jgi:hypothetical protein
MCGTKKQRYRSGGHEAVAQGARSGRGPPSSGAVLARADVLAVTARERASSWQRLGEAHEIQPRGRQTRSIVSEGWRRFAYDTQSRGRAGTWRGAIESTKRAVVRIATPEHPRARSPPALRVVGHGQSMSTVGPPRETGRALSAAAGGHSCARFQRRSRAAREPRSPRTSRARCAACPRRRSRA